MKNLGTFSALPPTARQGPSIPILQADGPLQFLAPLPKLRFLVQDLITRGSVALMAGHSASLKSWAVLALAIAAATGTPWLNHFVVMHAPVLFLNFESGPSTLYRRVQGLIRGVGLEPSLATTPMLKNIGFYNFPSQPLQDDGLLDELELLLQRCPGALVIIDTLRAATFGLDENASDYRSVIDGLRKRAHASGATVIFVHHTKKNAKGREAVRGSSAIFDAVDVVLEFRRESDGGPARVAQLKSRDHREASPFVMALETDQDQHRHDIYRLRVVEEDPAKADDELKKKIVEFVRQNPGASQQRLRQHCGGRAEKVTAVANELVEGGTLKKGPGGRGYHSAAPPVPSPVPLKGGTGGQEADPHVPGLPDMSGTGGDA